MLYIRYIEVLVREKILSEERCPEVNYWRWDVLRLDLLPERLKDQYRQYGEIRWYGYERDVWEHPAPAEKSRMVSDAVMCVDHKNRQCKNPGGCIDICIRSGIDLRNRRHQMENRM